ncbi:MAG TPA: carboxymuconolactone decarboxylase family protein [Pseudomonadales bacterium]
MSAPRIAMLSEADALKLGHELGIDDYIAKMHLFRVLLNHPAVAREINSTIVALVGPGSALGARLRELIIMRVAWVSGSAYEWTQHWMASLFLGLTEAELIAVKNWQPAECFNAADRAVLAAVDDTLMHGGITASTWAAIKKALPSVEQQIEVTACIGNWHMAAQIIASLDIPLEDGFSAWPPNGQGPHQ